MDFTSQICTTKEQSERLLALGLKRETADMYYFWVGGNEYRLKVDIDNNPLKYNMDKTYIPAWSLHRLIEMARLPQYWECISGDWYEEVIAHIQSMIHINEFNKDYLEE